MILEKHLKQELKQGEDKKGIRLQKMRNLEGR